MTSAQLRVLDTSTPTNRIEREYFCDNRVPTEKGAICLRTLNPRKIDKGINPCPHTYERLQRGEICQHYIFAPHLRQD